jgi:protocatechuate 3,4-dioxygenase beta subunit
MRKIKLYGSVFFLMLLTSISDIIYAQCPSGIFGGPSGFGNVICSPSPTYNFTGGEPNSTWTIKQNGSVVATSTGTSYTLGSISGNNINVEVELTTPGCSQQTVSFNVKSASFTVLYGTGWYDVEFTENNASVTWGGPGIDWNDAGNSNVFYGICNSGTGTVTMTTSDGCTASQTINYTGVDAAISGPSSVLCGTSATYTGSQNGGTGTFSVSPANAGSFSGSTFTADANYNGSATITYTVEYNYSTPKSGTNNMTCTATQNIDITCCTPSSNTTTATACDSYTWSANGMTYASSGVYTYNTTNGSGCPHTETLNLTINNSTNNTTTETACDSYIWSVNGMTYASSGVYTYNTTNGSGCPHTETLNLTINNSTSNTTTETACDSYTWSVNGMTYASSGVYTYNTTNGSGCPHTETLNLTINNSTSNTTTETACDSYTWSVNGMTYASSGVYTYNTTNGSGCPHTETLNLTINNSTSNTTTATACDSYTWSVNGMTYASSGVYTYNTTNGSGCPHTETLNLTINNSTSNTTTETACDSYTWSVNGMTYASSGVYTYNTTNGSGCPHTETLNLTINNSTSNTTTATACDSYTWSVNGMTYASSGVYTYNTTNGSGCPHTETLNLTINNSSSTTTNLALCPSSLPYNWNGQSINSAGTYTYTTTNSNGCDSVATLILSINATSTSTTNLTLCVNQLPYSWNGQTLTSSGTYTYTTTSSTGCDSIAVLNLTLTKSDLGNYVWNDINQDGIQNSNEVGVSGVTVSLLNASTLDIISTVVTDAYGQYRFSPICAGSYKVQFSLPANYVFTGQNAPNDAIDSDPNVFTGITDTYVIVSGDSNMTVDAGIYQPLPLTATVGDRVWFDANSNGIQDIGESGVSGITVTLYNCSNPGVPVKTTITDAGGNYLFENVLPGDYQVGFSVPLGMLLTQQSGVVSDVMNSDVNPSTERTACFVVNSGDNITYVDAGLIPKLVTTASLGDKVWNDANQDGIQNPNETGVQGVTVTLYEPNGTTILSTTTTDGLGNYAFNGINAGCYIIGFSNLPSGYTFSPSNAGSDTSKNSDANPATGKTSTICIAAGQNNPTIDAGIYNATNTNSIGDKVWYDEDKDGLQDAGEYGYPGVVVTLHDCTSLAVMATTTTNANGEYSFSGLANGNYLVGFGFVPGYQFTAANADLSGILGANNSDANPSSGLTQCVSLTGNTNITTVDAGIYPGNTRNATSSLGDIVWVDVNNNGLQDAGEPGVSNVKVTLYESDGITIIDTTSTDGSGEYIFTNLTEGDYVVGFTPSTLPAGYTFTTQGSNIEDENNSDANTTTGKTNVITLGLGEDKMNVDAGIVPPASTVCLGNYVWIDIDQDGTQDANEPGMPGVSVNLYDNNTNTILQRATTNVDGSYLFCGLNNGSTYSVGFENLPAGFVFTTQTGALNVPDNSDANPITGRTTTVTLGSTNDLTLDAGIYSTTTAVVGNYVWYDEDADGIQDPTEAPIPGVLVTLYDNTNTPVSSAVTDANGGYLFTNVTPGNYVIGFSGYPSSLVPTSKGSNASADDDSNIDPNTGLTDVFTVTPGSSNLTLDAGYKANPVAGLGNYVWHDLNENGLQDPTEAPISGVVVTLYASDGTTPLGTAITDGNGAYSFPNLTAGSYIVGFSNLPNAYTRTRIIGVLNDALNSDINANNQTALITLSAGTYNPNIDAGFYMGVPLGARELVATLVKQQGANQAIVNWYTKDEENTATFEIQRSTNGSDYTQVGTKAAGGTTQGQTNYSAIDDISGLDKEAVIYYRIKLIDIDAQQKYSNTISLKLGTTTNGGVLVHPIPFTNRLTVTYVAEMDENITLELLDMSGRVIARSEKLVTKGLNNAVLDNLESLSSSQYLLRIVPSGDGETQVIRVNK